MSAGMARRKVKTSALQDGDPRKKDKKKGWYSGWTKYILTEVRDFFLLLGGFLLVALIWGIWNGYYHQGMSLS